MTPAAVKKLMHLHFTGASVAVAVLGMQKYGMSRLIITDCLARLKTEIASTLSSLGVAFCVAREWAQEPRRRKALMLKVIARKERKEASKFGAKGAAYRRIIHTKRFKTQRVKTPIFHFTSGKVTLRYDVHPGRELHFHATKGWRSYRSMS